jgi:hypothetical protein
MKWIPHNCWEIPISLLNQYPHRVQTTGWAIRFGRCATSPKTSLAFRTRRIGVHPTTAFTLRRPKESLAAEIETVLVPVFRPLAFERLYLQCWSRYSAHSRLSVFIFGLVVVPDWPSARIIARTLTRGSAMGPRIPHLGHVMTGEGMCLSDRIRVGAELSGIAYVQDGPERGSRGRRRGISHCVENTQSEIPPPRFSRGRNDSLDGVFTQSLMSPRDTPKHENHPSPQLLSPSSLSPREREEGKGVRG